MDPSSPVEATGTTRVTMSREEIGLRLREVALFQGLGSDDLSQILDISEAVRVDGNDYVFEEGERGDHFFVIVQGRIELRKTTSGSFKKLAVLKAGQAFGEMALLNQTPRSASAYALEPTYLLSVSRAAFSQMLGGDTLAVRLLKNLSKALWATSVRLATQQPRTNTDNDTGHETLSEFNRLLRARLLPRVTPRVSGYDIAASTLAPRKGSGSTAWDWFVLADGRPAFAVSKSVDDDLFAAQRLAAVRMMIRSEAAGSHPSLGALLSQVNRGVRSGWVEGLSGPVMVGLVALADGAAEWVEAGPVTGIVARSRGSAEDLGAHAPPIGSDAEAAYESLMLVLSRGDRIVALTDSHSDAVGAVANVQIDGAVASSRDALARVIRALEPVGSSGSAPSDLSAAIITRTSPGR
ncbi:MAG: cyclic nucleotide-binding domain-containing protein [Gemmatimonadota bacterium]